jgi:hypothetical protein
MGFKYFIKISIAPKLIYYCSIILIRELRFNSEKYFLNVKVTLHYSEREDILIMPFLKYEYFDRSMFSFR